MLWTPFIPMDPVLRMDAFDDDRFAFQVKWDGVRILAHCDGISVRLFNKRQHERTSQYPDLTAATVAACAGRSAILDGEAVAFQGGVPHFPTILRRDWASAPETIRLYSRRFPVLYMVFDLLFLDGRSLLTVPFCEREAMLRAAIPQGEVLHHVESFPGHGRMLFNAVRDQGLEGMVAKGLDSHYRLGGKSPDWLKVKAFRHLDCVVGGFLPARGGIASLAVGQYGAEGLHYAGQVGTGLSARLEAQLLPELQQLQCPSSPFLPAPRRGARLPPGLIWVRPGLTVRVAFLEWTDELQLRQPRLLGLSHTQPIACRLEP